MKLTVIPALLALLPLAIASEQVPKAVSEASALPSLTIDKTHIPESCRRPSKTADTITVEYRGTLLTTGELFDQSYGRRPFTFKLGAGRVIKGWDTGLLDMCIGEKRTLTIPPELAYGQRGRPPKIPESSTLVFEVELVGIEGWVESKVEEAEHVEL